LCIATWRSRSSAVPDCATTSAGLLETRDALAQQDRVVREHDAPCVAELRDGAAEGAESRAAALGDHLMDALGVGKALQAMGLEVARLDAGHERCRGGREQDLAAVPRGGDAEARITSSPV
jgi:hypothetical protein